MLKTEVVGLGETIRKARRRLHISQKAMADACGLSHTYLCDVERGARNVSFGSLRKIALGLRMTYLELMRNVESGGSPRLKATHSKQARSGRRRIERQE